MAQDPTSALNDHGLSWKPDSLAFLANKVAAATLASPFDVCFPILDRQGNPWWYPRVDTMPCLGVLLTPSGDSLAAVEHRTTAGQQHYVLGTRCTVHLPRGSEAATKGPPLLHGWFYHLVGCRGVGSRALFRPVLRPLSFHCSVASLPSLDARRASRAT